MRWDDLLAGIAIYFILEGLFPFINPRGWLETLKKMQVFNESQIRTIGLMLIGLGLTILFIAQ